jgi:signal-transduction protein with cAMP-binding, CBS, and nucleotidyltransferase domain
MCAGFITGSETRAFPLSARSTSCSLPGIFATMIKSGHGLIFCFKVSRDTDSTMISAKESQDFLESIPIFAGLERSALALIADAVEQTFFHAGETIVGEAEAGNRMFIVQTGRVEVVKNLGGMRETALAVLGPKEFFGEMCIIECLTRCASVRAIEDTYLFALKSTDLHRLFGQQPDQYAILILNIARDISRRLRALDELFAAVSH